MVKQAKVKTKDEKDLEFFLERKSQLQLARTQSGIEKIWKQADADYAPHQLGNTIKSKKVLVENERTEVSSYVSLEKDAWRSKEAKNDPYIKIQTAISILFDRNPEAVLEPESKRYEANNKLIAELYHRTWTDTKIGAKKELRKFIFNLGKYGWSPARRYYKHVVRKDMQIIKDFNTETKEFVYEKKDIVDMDDVYFEAKSPFDCWIDDMARPDDPLTRRDWMWREVWDKETTTNVLGQEIADMVEFSQISEVENSETTLGAEKQMNRYTSTNLAVIWFYENRLTDKYMMMWNDKLLKSSPLQRDDKELSLVDTYWTLRDMFSPYGIGLNEIMRSNKVMLDRVRNMTIDQVVLSIYKMIFTSNAEQLDDEGNDNVSIDPGKIKKVIDPKNIAFFEIPGPGQDAFNLIAMLEKDAEDDTGITKTLEGEVQGKTAFEIDQAQQGALKRLNTPLRNIKSALEWDALLCINTMQMIYSIPKVKSLVDPELIADYVAGINDDKERYFVSPDGTFNVLKYREFQLFLEAGPDGSLQHTDNKQFFMIKPSVLDWAGQITIRSESMIEKSKSLERASKLEMSNILIPVIAQMASNPAILMAYIGPVKQLLKLYDEDPKAWLPAEWLQPQAPLPPVPTLATDPNANPANQAGAISNGAPQAEQVNASATQNTPVTDMGMVNKVAQKLVP
jgi:hypothetical protein